MRHLKGLIMRDDTREEERLETLDELGDLLVVLQQMGERLANETHGSAYADVHEFNALLHQARLQLDRIKGEGAKA